MSIAEPALADELPIPRFFEKEGGPYITAGAIVAKDRVSGHTNLSIARLMPLGGNRAFVGIAPNHHLAVLARAAHARGEKLDIAVCIGNHPAVLVAACLYLGLGDDELPVAGALLGEPLEVVRCTQSDLLVPAHCECVLEGTLDAGEPFMEGPVSEFHGMYEDYGRRHRRDVLAPDAPPRRDLPGRAAGLSSANIACSAAWPSRRGCLASARNAVPSVREVAVGLGGAGRLHAVVSLRAPRPGEARKAMFAVWAAVNLIKQVVVVDDDIDPWDTRAGRMGDGDAREGRTGISSSFRRCAPIAPSRSKMAAPSPSSASMRRCGRATGRTGPMARPPEQALTRAREILRDKSALATIERRMINQLYRRRKPC